MRVKKQFREVMVRDILFVDVAGIATHTVDELHNLMDRLSVACTGFGLITSLPKTNILPQGSSERPSIRIGN